MSTETPETTQATTEDLGHVSEEEFLAAIRGVHPHGCFLEVEVPTELHAAMSSELVEWRGGQWVSTGKVVDNTKEWGVRVRFTYYGNLARCLTGDIKITIWWDGFSNLPEGHKDHTIPNVDPCKDPHQYVVVIPMTGEVKCPDEQGVYDVATTLDFLCCGRPIVLGHCDLHAVRVTC